jgi:hypothetical protein
LLTAFVVRLTGEPIDLGNWDQPPIPNFHGSDRAISHELIEQGPRNAESGAGRRHVN